MDETLRPLHSPLPSMPYLALLFGWPFYLAVVVTMPPFVAVEVLWQVRYFRGVSCWLFSLRHYIVSAKICVRSKSHIITFSKFVDGIVFCFPALLGGPFATLDGNLFHFPTNEHHALCRTICVVGLILNICKPCANYSRDLPWRLPKRCLTLIDLVTLSLLQSKLYFSTEYWVFGTVGSYMELQLTTRCYLEACFCSREVIFPQLFFGSVLSALCTISHWQKRFPAANRRSIVAPWASRSIRWWGGGYWSLGTLGQHPSSGSRKYPSAPPRNSLLQKVMYISWNAVFHVLQPELFNVNIIDVILRSTSTNSEYDAE